MQSRGRHEISVDSPCSDRDLGWMRRHIAKCRRAEWFDRDGGVPSAAPDRPTIASASPGASAAPTMRVDEPWIAYQWEPERRQGLYLVRPDGTRRARDRSRMPPADAFHPDWSPDGTQIAFDAETDEGNEIWVVDADGTNAAAIVPRSTDCAISCGDVALAGMVARRFEDRVRPVPTRRERSRGGRHRSPGRRQRRSAGLVQGTVEDGPGRSALVPRWAVHRVRDDAVPGHANQPRYRHGIRDRRHLRHRGGRQARRPDRLVDVRELPRLASGIR